MLITARPSLRTTNRPLKGRGHCHVTSLIFKNFAVCRDAARREGLSATAELLVEISCADSYLYRSTGAGAFVILIHYPQSPKRDVFRVT